eukprot:s462_g76.t1
MGKAMKAMKAHVAKVLTMKKKKKKGKKEEAVGKEESPAKGKSTTSPAKGKTHAKGSAMKKPASVAFTLPKDEGLSREEKMDAFHKKGNQSVNDFLDSLAQPQREALWGRFSRARDALKDPAADKMWNVHLCGIGSPSLMHLATEVQRDHLAGEEALSDVLPDKEKKQKNLLALADKMDDEKDDDEEDQLKAAADEADVLSDLGPSKNKEQTAKRVLKMVKLLKGLIS